MFLTVTEIAYRHFVAVSEIIVDIIEFAYSLLSVRRVPNELPRLVTRWRLQRFRLYGAISHAISDTVFVLFFLCLSVMIHFKKFYFICTTRELLIWGFCSHMMWKYMKDFSTNGTWWNVLNIGYKNGADSQMVLKPKITKFHMCTKRQCFHQSGWLTAFVPFCIGINNIPKKDFSCVPVKKVMSLEWHDLWYVCE